MKFLAMLKDSLRETLDVKLFHVLVVLSALVVLFVFSITYKPLPMEPQIKRVIERFPSSPDAWIRRLVERLAPDGKPPDVIPQTEIKDFQRADNRNPDQPWLGDYHFTLALRLLTIPTNSGPLGRGRRAQGAPSEELVQDVVEDLKKAEAAKKLLTQEFMERLCRDSFDFLEEVNVENAASSEGNVINFTVKTHGCKIKTAKGWYYQPYLFFGLLEVPQGIMTLLATVVNFDPDSLNTLGDMVSFIGDRVIGSIGALFTMFLSIIMTASFLPNMLMKGSVDLLLVKPIHRTTLFLYKFTGSLLFMFLTTTAIMVGIWLALGVQTGLWAHSLLLCIPIFTFQAVIFYAVAAVVSVLTRSTVLSILAAFMTWMALFVVGWSHYVFIDFGRAAKAPSTKSHWAYVGYDSVKAALPRYKDIDWLTTRMIRTELNDMMYPEGVVHENNAKKLEEGYGLYDWGTSLLVTSVFIALMLSLACWRFAVKDY